VDGKCRRGHPLLEQLRLFRERGHHELLLQVLQRDQRQTSSSNTVILLIAQQKQGTTIPLFYKVAPSHVRNPERPESPFSQAFQRYQCRKEIDEWKAALEKVSFMFGWTLDETNGYEAELVKLVVEEVRKVCKK